MNEILDFTCKFCGQPGRLEYERADPGPARSWFDLAKLVPDLTCNRCALYERTRRDLNRQIMRLASKLVIARQIIPVGNPNRAEVENQVRTALVQSTKRFGQCVAQFWAVQFIWEPDLISAMMENPTRAKFILSGYIRALKQPLTKPTML